MGSLILALLILIVFIIFIANSIEEKEKPIFDEDNCNGSDDHQPTY